MPLTNPEKYRKARLDALTGTFNILLTPEQYKFLLQWTFYAEQKSPRREPRFRTNVQTAEGVSTQVHMRDLLMLHHRNGKPWDENMKVITKDNTLDYRPFNLVLVGKKFARRATREAVQFCYDEHGRLTFQNLDVDAA